MNNTPKKQANNTSARGYMLDELRLEVAKGWDGPDSKRTVKDIIVARNNLHKQLEEYQLGRLMEKERTDKTVSRKRIFKYLGS